MTGKQGNPVLSILSLLVLPLLYACSGAAPIPDGGNTPGTSVLERPAPGQAGDSRSGAAFFIANEGQLESAVAYYQRGPRRRVFFTPEGVFLSFTDREQRRFETAKIGFVGARKDVRIEGEEELAGRVNYFAGSDPKGWQTGIPTFGAVVYRDLYPGIDLRFYHRGGTLEYDVVVRPGGDLADVRFTCSGGADIRIGETGGLEVAMEGGTLLQKKPYVYQEEKGIRTEVPGSFVLHESSGPPTGQGTPSWSFEVAAHDGSRTLVVDPQIVYSTYLGGSSNDEGRSIAVDSQGSVYVAGTTGSLDFPTTTGSFQETATGGSFITKFDSAGTTLVYSTYFTATGGVNVNDIAVDAAGNAYVVGTTTALDLPVVNAFQPAYGGGFSDVFVAKLSADGSALIYSTYLGGTISNTEAGNGIAVDAAGNAYVTGHTYAPDFPTFPPLAPLVPFSGSQDAFVTKLDPTGSALVYSTHLGGFKQEEGHDIAVDSAGNAYVVGQTTSTDFPTVNAFQSSKVGTHPDYNDVFVTKINPAGEALVYSTYIGGNWHDVGHGIAIDGGGNAYITGRTSSSDYPVTPDSFMPVDADNYEAFLTKLDPSGSSLAYSTYLGGSFNDNGYGVAVDGRGHAYVTGETSSCDFPVEFPLQASSCSAAFVAKFSVDGGSLVYSTPFGGDIYDPSYIAVDGDGNAYVTGLTGDDGFPTVDPFQATRAGGDDAFVTKIATKTDDDWDRDGQPDILWCNGATGENYLWYMDGPGYLSGTSVPSAGGTGWEVVSTADFDGNGEQDLLWRNSITGDNHLWYMDGTAVADSAFVPPIADMSWRVAGVADFNGDDSPDILWRNDQTGNNFFWFMSGSDVVGVAPLQHVPDTWLVEGAADFNGDDSPDILWRNSSTGIIYIWYLEGTTVLSASWLTTVADTDWMIVGTPDVSMDGNPDLLWRHSVSGNNYLWYMKGLQITGGAAVTAVSDTGWHLVQ